MIRGHWQCNARLDQHTGTLEIRDCTHTRRTIAERLGAAAEAANQPRPVGLAGKLIGYDYRARAIARRRAK